MFFGSARAAAMLAAAGGLYAAGMTPAWDRVMPSGRVVPLPAYPWQRERCWLEVPRVGANGYQHGNGYHAASRNGHGHLAADE